MKANELRIGNWAVDPHEKRYFKVTAFDIQFLDDGGDSESIQPIPLTNEIRKKAGDFVDFSANHYDHIQYVHQLQNLYFALTGEELNINL